MDDSEEYNYGSENGGSDAMDEDSQQEESNGNSDGSDYGFDTGAEVITARKV